MVNRINAVTIAGVHFLVRVTPWVAHLAKGGIEQLIVSMLIGTYLLAKSLIKIQREGTLFQTISRVTQFVALIKDKISRNVTSIAQAMLSDNFDGTGSKKGDLKYN